jgi:hypothetical protein
VNADNTDRILQDLKQTIDKLPPTAIGVVLETWRVRIDDIRKQLKFTGRSLTDVTCPAARELMTLEMAVRQIEAACAVERGDGLDAIRILLNPTP